MSPVIHLISAFSLAVGSFPSPVALAFAVPGNVFEIVVSVGSCPPPVASALAVTHFLRVFAVILGLVCQSIAEFPANILH